MRTWSCGVHTVHRIYDHTYGLDGCLFTERRKYTKDIIPVNNMSIGKKCNVNVRRKESIYVGTLHGTRWTAVPSIKCVHERKNTRDQPVILIMTWLPHHFVLLFYPHPYLVHLSWLLWGRKREKVCIFYDENVFLYLYVQWRWKMVTVESSFIPCFLFSW